MSRPIDVIGVMTGLEDLARHRLLLKRRDFDKMQAKGITPHPVVVAKADRAEYLRDQAVEARAAVAELIEAAQEVIDGTVNATTYPDGPCIERADRDRLIAALARVTPMAPEQQAEQVEVRG